MTTHVVITGPMGVGKTTLGSELAERLGAPFYDNDEHIERVQGRTGREIAEEKGVIALHELERAFLDEKLQGRHPSVIAAAASIADDARLLRTLVARGHHLVFLAVATHRIAEMAQQGAHRRPIDGQTAVEMYRRRRDDAIAVGATTCRVDGPEDPADLIEAAVRSA